MHDGGDPVKDPRRFPEQLLNYNKPITNQNLGMSKVDAGIVAFSSSWVAVFPNWN